MNNKWEGAASLSCFLSPCWHFLPRANTRVIEFWSILFFLYLFRRRPSISVWVDECWRITWARMAAKCNRFVCKSNFFIEISSWSSVDLLYIWLSSTRSWARIRDSKLSCKKSLHFTWICFCSARAKRTNLQLFNLWFDFDGLSFQCLYRRTYLKWCIPIVNKLVSEWYRWLVLQIGKNRDEIVSLRYPRYKLDCFE